MDNPIDEGCITSEELPASLKLVERDILKAEDSKLSALPEALDQRSPPRMTLAIVATCAGSVTLAWLAFMVWLIFRGVSLL
jgi:hypothetical protein